jgi:hypothetical protein
LEATLTYICIEGVLILVDGNSTKPGIAIAFLVQTELLKAALPGQWLSSLSISVKLHSRLASISNRSTAAGL